MDERYDLVIGGGGTYGPAIFLTALLSGIKRVALVEKGRIGRGLGDRAANYASTRIIQPGLKYIQSDLSVVEIDALDCALLHSLAGDLLEERKFILPVYKDYKFPLSEPWIWENVLRIYDKFSRMAGHPRHEQLSRANLLQEEPGLQGKLAEGVAFYEWLTNPVALSAAFVAAGVNLGGSVFEKNEISSFECTGSKPVQKIDSVVIRGKNGDPEVLKCRYFVNACGAWAPRLARLLEIDLRLRLTKGTTIIVSKRLVRHPVVVFDKQGHYLTFIPWDETTAIGPTNHDVSETVLNNPDLLRPELFEINELLGMANHFLGTKITKGDIVEIKCGLRPQLNHRGVDLYDITHAFAIFNHIPNGIVNALSLGGGKLSSQLRIAKEVVEQVCHSLGEKFVWKIPYTKINRDGELRYVDRPLVPPLYRKECALRLRCGENVEKLVFESSLARKSQAMFNILWNILRNILNIF